MEYNWLGDCENFHRRDFLKVGMLSLLGLSTVEVLRAGGHDEESRAAAKGAGTADSCVLIWLGGGPSHLDTFDPEAGRAAGNPRQLQADQHDGERHADFRTPAQNGESGR